MNTKLFLLIALLSVSQVAITQKLTIDYDENSGQSKINLDSGGISIVENGKVFALTTINKNILYRVFVSNKTETDLGLKYLKYRDSKGKLLWQIQLNEEQILCNNKKKLILATSGNSKLQFYSVATGKLLEAVNLGPNHILNDGCECVSTNTTTYVKSADPINFAAKEIIVIKTETFPIFK
jgi:hypothetical protein